MQREMVLHAFNLPVMPASRPGIARELWLVAKHIGPWSFDVWVRGDQI